jgi:hypothetical protein
MSVLRSCAWWMLAVGLVLPSATHGASSASKKTHKLIVYPEAGETVAELKARGISTVDNYGSYWVVEADDAQTAELEWTHGARAVKADHLNRIELSAAKFDTTVGEPPVPAHLRQVVGPGKRLRLVQFKGPVLPEWLEQLKAAGKVKIVSYVPNNAYVVWLDAKAEKALENLKTPAGPIQWIGAYHGSYKMRAELMETTEPGIEVSIGVVNGSEAEQTLRTLALYALEPPGQPGILRDQAMLKLKVAPSALPALAQMPDVLWIERSAPMEPKDEQAALVMANRTTQLPGHTPVPGVDDYLDFLTNTCGFSTNAFEYPLLDVADTLATVTTVFNDFFEGGNPSNQTRLGGFISLCPPTAILCEQFHGPFVMSVAGGFNGGKTDTNNLDGAGFRKGMSVSPFGRISNTILFNVSGNACVFCVPNSFHPQISDIPLNEYQALGARISNNSWGEVPVAGTGGNLGIYNGDSRSYDITVRDALSSGTSIANSNGIPPNPFPLNQEIVTVFAGGNDQALGSGNGGFGDVIVTPPATAKNVITVGASENVQPLMDANACGLFGNQADNSQDISFFSSFGPTIDGRIKPEIVAPGSAIYGINGPEGFGFFDTNTFEFVTSNAYTCASGTSFSAPAVSGAIQLLWWWFQHRLQNEQGLNLLQPSPAMAKAYLCNAARYLPITNPQTGAIDTLPSIAQGMGIIDLARMFDNVPRTLRDETTARAIDTPLLTTNPVPQQTYFSRSGQSYEVSGRVADATQPFRVTLAWLDAPGNPAAFQQLVNNLDLEVRVGGKAYRGNVFTGPNSVTGGAIDSVNNMESVFLPAGQTGTWSVVVKATNIAGDGVGNVRGTTVGQDFALVVYNSVAGAVASDVPNLATNDTCQTALNITSFPFTFTNNLTKSVYHNVHPSPSAARGGAEEFFRIDLPTAGAQFTVNTFGSSFDTVLSVWRVQLVPQTFFIRTPCGALVEQVSNNDAGGGNQSQLTFTADGSNSYYIVVEPHNDGAGGKLVLNVQATGLPVSVAPSVLGFGAQIVGTTSAVQTVTFRNISTVPVNITDVHIEGADASEFVIVTQDCEGNTLAPGTNCTIGVAFAPSTNLARSAQLVIQDDAIGSPRIVLLNGTGLPPAPLVCASASSVDFGGVAVGTTSSVQSVIITNCGTRAMNISSVHIAGANSNHFLLGADTCSGQMIPVDGICSFDVSFAPTDTGPLSASVIISNDTPFNPQVILLTGVGRGSQPDGLISKRRKENSFIGNNIYNTTGAGQELAVKAGRGRKKVFFVRVQNDGNSADTFRVEGTGDVPQGISVRYFLGAIPREAVDITSAVQGGAYSTATMEASAFTGDATLIRVEVTVDKQAASGSYPTLITLRSASAPAKADAVKATVIVR